jgi:hypothetical protein
MAQVAPDTDLLGHDVRHHRARGSQDVLDRHTGQQVRSQAFHHGDEQLGRVQGVAGYHPPGMTLLASEDEFSADDRHAGTGQRGVLVVGVAGQQHVGRAEQAGLVHDQLPGHDFLSRGAEDDYLPRKAGLAQQPAHRDGGRDVGRSYEVVPASVAGTAGHDRRAGRLCRIAQPGQRVILGQHPDPRPRRPLGGQEGGRQAGYAGGDIETFVRQPASQHFRRVVLGEAQLRHFPQLCRDRLRSLFDVGPAGGHAVSVHAALVPADG